MSNIIHPNKSFVNGNPPKIVFLGTPEFAMPILEKLINSGYKPVAVFCAPDKPVGRKQLLTPPPVKVAAQKYDIPVYQPANSRELANTLKTISYDLIITAAYGFILTKEVLDAPEHGCLNVHPSLLPKYRGASPIQTAILNGDEETGVTIYKMDEQIDHGAIIAQEKIQINNAPRPANAGLPPLNLRGGGGELSRDIYKLTTPELSQILSNLGADLLLKTLPDWLAGKITPKPQDDSQATFTKIITKEDGQIDWEKSAEEIERQIRAYTPWPGSHATLPNYSLPPRQSGASLATSGNDPECSRETIKGSKIKILDAEATEKNYGQKPGKISLADDGSLAVQTGSGALIIKKLQLEGGKPMNAKDFLRGHKEIIGTILQ